MRNKKGMVIPVWLFFVIAAVAAVIFIPNVAQYLNLGALTGSDQFVKPVWASLECAPTDSYEGTFSGNVPSSGLFNSGSRLLFKCDANTDECIVTATTSGGSGLSYKLCDSNGNNCGGGDSFSSSGFKTLPVLQPGQSYSFQRSAVGSASVSAKWKPWKLYRRVGGAKYIVNSYDCSIQSGDLSKIRKEDYSVPTLLRQGAEGTKWVNYVDDWVYGPATNIVSYNGQQAYCTGGKVYSIVQLQMADGSLKKVDPSYSGTTTSGDKISGLGNVISSVECCPNEPNCGSDFKYHKADAPEATAKGCFSDLQCYNAGGPVPQSGYTYVKYSCQSGTCVQSAPVTVQCTTNAQCSKNGQICDLSTMNYGQCITQKSGEFCGDGVCQITENHDKCAADCEFTCPQGQTLITKSTTNNFVCTITFGIFCRTTSEKYCGTPGTDWTTYLLYIFLGLVLLVALRYGLPYIKALFMSLRRFLP